MEKVESAWASGKKYSENSEWMVDNVQGLDEIVKKMLVLIEHDPMQQAELIGCIKEISHRHHLLVDHYNKLTGDVHPFVTPKKRTQAQIVPCELVYATPNEGFESSLLSTDSDSESYDSSPEKMLKHETETMKGLMSRILDYEKELKASKETLEGEIARHKGQLEKKDVEISGIEAQLESAQNRIKMHQVESEEEKKTSLMLQAKIFDLQAKLESEKTRVEELENELLDRDGEIEKLNFEIQERSANFTLQKQHFESVLSQRLQKQCESFEAEKVEMLKNQEALIANWKDNIEQVKMEVHDKNVVVDTLNNNLDKLKQNYDMVTAEKDELNAKLQSDVSIRDNQIQCIERDLNHLRLENDEANKVIAELKSRMSELEKDVGMQKVQILEIGEEKREAIRQLCFALDHFRSVYQQHVFSKRPTAFTLFRLFFR